MPQFIKATAISPEAAIYELVKAHGRDVVSSVTDMTDNSAGAAGATVVAASTALVNAANSGTNLASAATATSALGTVVDALGELYSKANAYATKLGFANITYNGGGAAADGTIGAVTVSTTAAATGAQAVSINADLVAINDAFYNLTALTNRMARALGYAELTVFQGVSSATIAAISTAAGTAADPGVTKVALDAELVKLANNVATIAAKLNAFNNGLGNALVTIA